MNEELMTQEEKPRRYSRLAFWVVKSIMLVALAVWGWNVAKESGRQEILSKRPVKYFQTGEPICVWGEVVYPVTAFDSKKLIVKVKKDSL